MISKKIKAVKSAKGAIKIVKKNKLNNALKNK